MPLDDKIRNLYAEFSNEQIKELMDIDKRISRHIDGQTIINLSQYKYKRKKEEKS